ncbi:MAG: HEPN domain-containing protein [Deinococcota bacterium]|jgi:HEPN domain-containing protein|nr:HEPN domain-containing protein [Deinococcota bacterium]
MPLDVAPWIEKAEEDWRVVNLLVERGTAWGAVAFHAQQCAEKYLKALLITQGNIPPKSHDLVVLARLTSFSWNHEVLARLSTYAVASRYPEAFLGEAEGRWSLEQLEQLRPRLRELLGLEPPG